MLVRLKSDITVTKIGGFLPDGSYMADIGGKDGKIRMRVIGYFVHVDGQDVPEMFCLATDLDDWHAYPAESVRNFVRRGGRQERFRRPQRVAGTTGRAR